MKYFIDSIIIFIGKIESFSILFAKQLSAIS